MSEGQSFDVGIFSFLDKNNFPKCMELVNKSDQPMFGPSFSDGTFTSAGHKSQMEYEECVIRRKEFKNNLDILDKRHNHILLTREDDWERVVTNLENDIENLVMEYLEVT